MAEEATSTDAQETGGSTTTATATEPRTFTQDELDRIVNERVNKAKQSVSAQFRDHKELQEKAARLEELEAASQTESQRLQAQLEKTNRQVAELTARESAAQERAQTAIVKAAVVRSASQANAADPEDVFALMDHSLVSIDENGTPVGVERAVEALLSAKPHLVRRGSGGGFDGGARGAATTDVNFNDVLRADFGISAQ